MSDALALSTWGSADPVWQQIATTSGDHAEVIRVVGTYGVSAYGVSERMSEFGIRTALAATSGDIRKLVLGEAALLTLLGIVIGGLATIAMSHTLIRFVYGISVLDLVTFIAAPAVLASAALLATFIPAHRAARADPMRVLRSE